MAARHCSVERQAAVSAQASVRVSGLRWHGSGRSELQADGKQALARSSGEADLNQGNRNHHDLRRTSALIEQVKVVAGGRNHHDLLFRAAA